MTHETLPDLEERFLPPAEWQQSEFHNKNTEHKITYSPLPHQAEEAVIVILPGLSEFGEKYIETAKELSKEGFSLYVIDWAYQGRSTRLTNHPHRRHSDGYDTDISDLDYLITNIITTDKPIFLLGHSMGAHIGLRYLIEHPQKITAASFTAPMISPLAFRYISGLYNLILKFMPDKMLKQYVPGGSDWHMQSRKNDGNDIFSSDPIRDEVHNKWSEHDPELQVGNPTYQWIKETLASIAKLKENYHRITIPVLLALAENEQLIDNNEIIKAHQKIKSSNLLRLPNAKHEILMETDDLRSKFLSETLKLFKKSM